MYRTIPFRRAQEDRQKKKVKGFLKLWDIHGNYNNPIYMQNRFRWRNKVKFREMVAPWEDRREVGMMARTPSVCSNKCCGNQRRYFGATLQEVKHAMTALDTLEELCYNGGARIKNFKVRYGDPWSWT